MNKNQKIIVMIGFICLLGLLMSYVFTLKYLNTGNLQSNAWIMENGLKQYVQLTNKRFITSELGICVLMGLGLILFRSRKFKSSGEQNIQGKLAEIMKIKEKDLSKEDANYQNKQLMGEIRQFFFRKEFY